MLPDRGIWDSFIHPAEAPCARSALINSFLFVAALERAARAHFREEKGRPRAVWSEAELGWSCAPGRSSDGVVITWHSLGPPACLALSGALHAGLV